MGFILEKIEEAIKELLIGWIESNMTNMFTDVNDKVGTIAAEVGKTPSSWDSSIYQMIRGLSENVIVPIAGIIITFVLCYELISMITEKNNLHDMDTWMFFKWFFKAAVAIYLVTNTFDIVMAVFDIGQNVVAGAAGVISGDTNIDIESTLEQMIGIPWMLAFSLRDSGWYLRNDIIWMKENPMPESVKDRCARCYEHIFLFSKSRKYFFDYKAISEPIAPGTVSRLKRGVKGSNKYGEPIPGQAKQQTINLCREHGAITDEMISPVRNKRDVWIINTVPFKGGHYAAYPPKLVETCLLAGCPKDGVVLDPFIGSGTTGMVAKQLDRHYVGIELNPEYKELAEARIGGEI